MPDGPPSHHDTAPLEGADVERPSSDAERTDLVIAPDVSDLLDGLSVPARPESDATLEWREPSDFGAADTDFDAILQTQLDVQDGGRRITRPLDAPLHRTPGHGAVEFAGVSPPRRHVSSGDFHARTEVDQAAVEFTPPLPSRRGAPPRPGAGPVGNPSPEVGFGAYRLVGRVGGGGMAEVLLALRDQGGRPEPCVIKRIAGAHHDDDEYLRLFREEGRVCLALDHPNVVRFFEFGEVDGIPFLSMELVDGVDLAQLYADAQPSGLPLRVVAEIGAAVAEALAYAWEAPGPDGRPLRIIHRDVSPQNILVSRGGAVKLADFGIARFEGRVFQTGMGPAKGKLPYIAPEQLSFLIEPDGRADLFSLGTVLAELITDQAIMPQGPLVAGELEPVLRAAFRRARRKAPEALEALLVEMTATHPDDRPARASAVAERLKAIARGLAGEGVRAFAERCVAPVVPSTAELAHRFLSGLDSGPLATPTSGRLWALSSERTPAYPTTGLGLAMELPPLAAPDDAPTGGSPASPAPGPPPVPHFASGALEDTLLGDEAAIDEAREALNRGESTFREGLLPGVDALGPPAPAAPPAPAGAAPPLAPGAPTLPPAELGPPPAAARGAEFALAGKVELAPREEGSALGRVLLAALLLATAGALVVWAVFLR